MAVDVEPYVEHLARLPFVRGVRVRRDGGDVDGHVVLATADRRKVTLPFELARSHLGKETARRLIAKARGLPELLVMAPLVGRALGRELVLAGVNYVDLAGNCHLNVDDRYVAHVEGRQAERPAPAARALRTPAFRVLFALLADPRLANATARTLADAAGGVSPQTANDARARFVADGTLVEARGELVWAPDGRRRAIDLFLTGYGALTAKLAVGRYRARGATAAEQEAAIAPHLDRLGDWRWGGGAAAQRMTGFYRGDQTIVYLRTAPAADVLRRLPLVPDRAGDVIVRVAPGPVALEAKHTAHPLLVYADLLAEGNDRAGQAAAQIYERYLASPA